MNIFKFEFKTYLKGNIIWTISLIAILFMFMSLFPVYSSQAATFEKLLENFPETFLKAFGMNNMFLSSVVGYYSFCFVYIGLIGGIFAMKLGLDVISKELREKTADFLLVKPKTRSSVIIPKFCAVLLHILIMNVVFFGASIVAAEIFKNGDYNLKTFMLINLSLFFIQFFLLSLGMMLSTFLTKLKSVLPLTLGVVFGFYVLQLLNQTLDDEKISYLTPFGHFDSAYISQNASFSSPHLIFSVALSLLFLILGYIIYNKRDIPSV